MTRKIAATISRISTQTFLTLKTFG